MGVSLLIVVLVSYVLYQARNFILGPSLQLYGADTVLHEDKFITLNGQARNIVKLTLNGKEIHTTTDGSFAQTVVLEPGYSIVTLYAEDRFGRTTTLTREYVSVPMHAENGEV